jgi:hypothetical protein
VGRLEEALMPWQGRQDTIIDRFDARTMMDHIQEYEAKERRPGAAAASGERWVQFSQEEARQRSSCTGMVGAGGCPHLSTACV